MEKLMSVQAAMRYRFVYFVSIILGMVFIFSRCGDKSDLKFAPHQKEKQGTEAKIGPKMLDVLRKDKIVAGSDHTCVLFKEGTFKCWGSHADGQIGTDETKYRFYFKPVTPAVKEGVIDIAANRGNTCVILSNQTVECWGDNTFGQLGNVISLKSSTPFRIPDLKSVVKVDIGDFHICALISDGSVRCWGENYMGQLGIQPYKDENDCISNTICRKTPGKVHEIQKAKSIASGTYHTCALLFNGHVFCWGSSSEGAIGYRQGAGKDTCGREGYAKHPCSISPVMVVGIDKTVLDQVIEVSSGGQHTCALMANRKVKCWGRGFVDVKEVEGIEKAKKISAGWNHNCAVLSTGMIKCWGLNDEGQLGNGALARTMSPEQSYKMFDGILVAKLSKTVTVLGINNAVDVTVGNDHSCALLADRTVQCWGSNKLGQLGVGANWKGEPKNIPVPVQVPVSFAK